MKKPILISMAALTLAALACAPINVNVNVPRLTTGPTETLTVNEPLPDSDSVVDVELRMGAGELNVTGGGESLASGDIKYNIADWKPTITNTGSSLIIEQGESNLEGFPDNDVVNEWNLNLGTAPMNLTIRAGAYQGDIDLSGVPLHNLTIQDGASQSEVKFDSVNPEEMQKLEYSSGASSVTLTGLANANFAEMEFNGGAGDYTLDFSGDLQRDGDVTVTGGVGSLRIIVPEGTNAKVVVTRGVGSVSADGSWDENGDVYNLEGSGPTLTIVVKMGVGSLELDTK